MGNSSASPSSLLCCLGQRKNKQDAFREMEMQREEGQALLRSMVVSSSEAVDWAAVIAKANELHRQEQAWLRKQTQRDRRVFRKRQQKALRQRRRFDSIGSFSVNLLTYRMADVTSDDESQGGRATMKSTTSVGSSTRDDSCSSSQPGEGIYFTRSQEDVIVGGMEPIREQSSSASESASSL
jgi:hypothetical protein